KRAQIKAGGAGGAGWAGSARGPERAELASPGDDGRAEPARPLRAVVRLASYQQAPLASRPVQELRPEERAKAAALLDRVIAAKGGLEKLRGIKTIVARQTLINQGAAGTAQTDTTNYIEYPDHFRIETPAVTQGYDGTQAWLKDQRGVHEAPESLARDARVSLRRDIVALLIAARAGALTPRVLPDVKDANGRV